MSNGKIVSIVIPTINEEKGIAKVINEIPKEELKKMGYETEILVVDGGSTDYTREIARKNGAKVVVEPELGYGRAYKTGFAYADGGILVTLDGDSSYPAFLIPKLVSFLDEKNLDFISTSRMKKFAYGSFSAAHIVGNKILTYCTRLLFRINVKDSQSGMWVFRKNVIEKLDVSADSMAFSEEIKVLAFRLFRSTEISVPYRKRIGKQKLRTLFDGVGNLIYLFVLRFSIRGFNTSKLLRPKHVRNTKSSTFSAEESYRAMLFSQWLARNMVL